jgi:flagellar hook-basal body complex protein FliE
VNSQLLQADQDTREMIAGKKDIHQAMISIEQAHISMRLLIQVRNKVISAYEEIMRMQF